jgi:putative SOS response-associated peptidase YedK
MRQDVTFRSETWEVLFTNILGSVGYVINMQTQELIPIIRRQYTDRKQHGRMHWQYAPPLKPARQQIYQEKFTESYQQHLQSFFTVIEILIKYIIFGIKLLPSSE